MNLNRESKALPDSNTNDVPEAIVNKLAEFYLNTDGVKPIDFLLPRWYNKRNVPSGGRYHYERKADHGLGDRYGDNR
ncbi:hypothetical protein N7U66_18145 [Lacinutrix neustonica]|uniref:Uncharacterized protein n=1 Tax=Lacinutrix neustonica TaxID=2980107 RepID=A0A9E8MWX6_9FLAO|nr:hypothetical protein [Lacinutrix neustonica]WAC01784.1 hypothetical protein N7U66_18145 [Lacinutrix neustonica]